jgi:peptidyl-prolyl cis-trans isomerase C
MLAFPIFKLGGDLVSEKIGAKHILVEQEFEVDDILKKLKEGAAFEDLARDFSKCPSGKKGGDLGEFGKGMMVKAFETAAFNLEIGEISGAIRTSFGFHIIKRTS